MSLPPLPPHQACFVCCSLAAITYLTSAPESRASSTSATYFFRSAMSFELQGAAGLEYGVSRQPQHLGKWGVCGEWSEFYRVRRIVSTCLSEVCMKRLQADNWSGAPITASGQMLGYGRPLGVLAAKLRPSYRNRASETSNVSIACASAA